MSVEQRIVLVEVQGVRAGSEWVEFHRPRDDEPRTVEAEAYAPASREQIDNARTGAPSKALDLRKHSGIPDQNSSM
jgi:hypothetical protein